MSRRSLALAITAVVLLALAVTWEVASPWWTLREMRDAAAARDTEKLATYVDFPRVRIDLREQLIGAADKRVPARAFEALLGKHRVNRVVDRVIDNLVSPESLRIALDAAAKRSEDRGSPKPTCGMKRESLDQFRLRCAQLPTGQADLEFERERLAWRLVGIDLPR